MSSDLESIGPNDGIWALNPDAPAGTQLLSEADNHIRNVKEAVQNTFPNITEPVTATADKINQAANRVTENVIFANLKRDGRIATSRSGSLNITILNTAANSIIEMWTSYSDEWRETNYKTDNEGAAQLLEIGTTDTNAPDSYQVKIRVGGWISESVWVDKEEDPTWWWPF